MAAYAISKTALLGLVKALSLTVVSKNIRVNAIAPGLIKTKFSEVVSTIRFVAVSQMTSWVAKLLGLCWT